MDINKIQDKRLIDCFNKIDEDNNKEFLKGNMFRNCKDKIIITEANDKEYKIIKSLAEAMYPIVFNEDLLKALNIPNYFPYTKQLLTAENLLFKKEKHFYEFFNSIVFTPNGIGPNYYQYIWFLESMGMYCNKKICLDILNFLNDPKNSKPIYYPKDRYLTLEEEIDCLKKFNFNIKTNDYDNFSKENERLPEQDIKDAYFCKKIGNIGELYFYQCVKDNLNNKKLYFVARDGGNGYGYDFLLTSDLFEELVEAKATIRKINDEDDYFKITDNEYKVLLQTLEYIENHSKTKYAVERIFLDDNYGLSSSLKLIPKDEKNLLFYENENIRYINANNEVDEKGSRVYRKKIITKG